MHLRDAIRQEEVCLTESSQGVFVAYVPSLDLRQIDAEATPFVHGLLQSMPCVRLNTQPFCDPFPTVATGVNPEQHGVWQVERRLGGDAPAETTADRWLDRLPDALSTTWQCAKYAFDRSHDLPAMPRRRRRRIEMRRIKFAHRAKCPDLANELGGVPTLFGLLGDEARYRGHSRFEDLPGILETLPDPRYRLDMLEFHALDLLAHWNMDRPSVMREATARVDAFLSETAEKCERQGTRFVLLVDHGHERVAGSVNLETVLRDTGVPRNEYLYFVNIADARFWFETDRARRIITDALEATPHVKLLQPDELHAYGIRMDPARFGELYLAAEDSHLFFPNDFYNPIANLYMAITEPTMRRRFRHRKHRGIHSRLPHHASEQGYLLSTDPSLKAIRERAEMVDIAPTLLNLIHEAIPPHMTGQPVFKNGA